jgi:aminoglycoside phosphotransferase (APT) family kinase protein
MSGERDGEGAIRHALAQAGYLAPGAPPRPEFRKWRWLTPLPEGRIAFFAEDPGAVARLGRERALLDLLGRRVGFAVPAVEHVSPDGRLQVRRTVGGTVWSTTEWFAGYGPGRAGRERALAASPSGRRLAGGLGRALAELHGSVTAAEAEALGVPAAGPLVPAVAELRERLAGRLPEPALGPALDAVLDGAAAVDEGEAGLVLTHGDACAGNMTIDPDGGALVGVFDFEYAALGGRHADFYALHSFADAFAEAVLDAYADASGVRPSIRWAAVHHLYAAFYALAGALATGDPDKVANQLRWVHGALAGAPGRLLGLTVARNGAR